MRYDLGDLYTLSGRCYVELVNRYTSFVTFKGEDDLKEGCLIIL